MTSIRRTLSLPLLAFAAACGSVPTKEFEFRVVDVADVPRPALIVVNDDWTTAAEQNQYVNLEGDQPLQLRIAFPSAEVDVTVAPVLVESGKVVRVPRSRKDARDYSGLSDDVRRLRITDPRVHLFVVTRKNGS